MESERPQVNPAAAVSTRCWGFYRGFQILLALLAWITLNKQSPPSPTSFVWSTYSQAATSTDGWLAHLYPEVPSETRCTSSWRKQLPVPSSRASLPLHPTPSPPTDDTSSQYPGKVRRETETSTVDDTVHRTANMTGKSPSPPSHLPHSSIPAVMQTFQLVFLSVFCLLLELGKLKISDAFQKAHPMPPSVFHTVHLLPLIYGEAP